ncbi:MAG: hypothetical protein NTV86_19440 [Planctomycetota bacterium]|nr:hypothetical protein [Planctomycetota bacterium]
MSGRIGFLKAAELKRQLDARRVTGSAPLIILFGVGLVVLGGTWAYEGLEQCVAHGWPVLPALLGGVIGWPVPGLLRQGRLTKDREWNAFVRQMPLGPPHLLAVHVYRAAVPSLAAAFVLACEVAGSGGDLLTPHAWRVWLILAVGLVWALSIQCLVGMVVSRLPRGRAMLAAAVGLWTFQLIASILWRASRAGGEGTLLEAFLQDPVLAILGAAPLAQALIEAHAVPLQATILASAHVAAIAAAFLAVAWRLALRPPVTGSGKPVFVALTKPLGQLIARGLPGSFGAQVCVEWLRTLRSQSMAVALYAGSSLVAAIILRTHAMTGGGLMGLLILVCFAMVEAGVLDILGHRVGNRLYDVLGVDPGHYVLGFATSVGVPAALLCILQIPVLCAGPPDWTLIGRVAAACLAAGVSVVPIIAGVDYFMIRSGRSQIVGTIGRLLGIAKAGFIVAIVPMYLFLVSTLHFALPLLFGCFFLHVEVRRCGYPWVRRVYWRLGND